MPDPWYTERHVEAFDGREVAALASGRPDELKRLDPLAALGVVKREQITVGDNDPAAERAA